MAKKEANAAWGKELPPLRNLFDRLCGQGPEVLRVSAGQAQARSCMEVISYMMHHLLNSW